MTSGVENKDKKDIRISLIIVCLNSVNCIKGAIDSFISQNYYNKELIIFDGMSTDGTHSIIEQYVQKYPEFIKWINNEKDSGISDARNKAIKYATGDYVGFLGADDRLINNIYSDMNKYYLFSEKDYFDIIYFDSLISKDKIVRPRVYVNSFLRSKLTSHIKFSRFNFLTYISFLPGEASYYHKSIFDSLKFNLKNKLTMDFEFNIDLYQKYKRNFRQLLVPQFGIISNFSDDNISTKFADKQFNNAMFILYKKFGKMSIPFILIRYFQKFIFNLIRNLCP